MKTATFLKPEHLAPIHNLQLRARLIVEGMIAGLHKSPYHGFSAEFLEYRSYLPGESIKKIDWRKFAKSDKTVVRLFEDETNLFAYVLIDKSASMGFRSENHMTKFDYAKTLAASIAWVLVRQRDAVGLACFDEKIDTIIPPSSTNRQLKAIIGALDATSTGARTQCGMAINGVAQMLRKRGMCIILSDLFDDPDRIIRSLRHLRFKRQDVIVLWVLDPLERHFSKLGSLKLIDLESGNSLRIDAKTASEYFQNGLAGHKEEIERACRELHIDIETVYTDEPFQRALLRVLEKRKRLF